ncbi:histidinol-phosphate transaminase [Candidatus Peregrinibacteria bacterium]|jgi:histidinol-phosphate aminotransferase|nr:histidinol-phosphate transaminase [Candidatus Peregrinibacteria bacterium]MBT4055751.1 histidinol-phosphate transaminase [Candidatus Peregrinibacteria bacterium]
MTNLANLNIQEMKPYSPPLEGRRSYEGKLLDFNERTVPISRKVIKALKGFMKKDRMQIYPEYEDLCEKIAEYSGVVPSQVMLTNGSDQGIDLIFRTFTTKGSKVVIPSPSFAMFYQCAQVEQNEIIKPAYQDDGSFPKTEVLEEIEKGAKLIIICNPNNPTGTAISLEEIEEITQKALSKKAMVYVDEAYFEFCKITAVNLTKQYPNLIVTRTFSKAFGLAALRIGYTISSLQNIEEMLKVRGPYDINMFATKAAEASLDDINSLNKYVDEVMNKAKPMVEDFFNKNRIEFIPSRANFLLFKTDNPPDVTEKLKKMGFLTRPRNGAIRVTIGTVKQMKNFINQFKNV